MSDSSFTVLVVSQDRELANRLSGLFVERNARVSWERRLDRVLELFETDTYDVLLATDTAFENGRVEGIEILEVIAAKSPVTQVLLLVAPKNIGLIGPALQAGTFLYTKLPVSDPELCLLVDTAVKQRPQFGVNELLKNAAAPVRFSELIGQSVPMQDVYRQIEQAAATDIPVLILGETGTGKDLVARAIHQRSDRRAAPCLAVNVGAIPVELVGSELFGHEKGAFTGAVARREGKFEQGNNGTLFLDEIGVIDEKIQVSLLRLLEHSKFHRLGGRQPITCDVRLIAATNADLTALVREGKFREDLFFRLDVFRISLPPLRERRGDIPLLLEAFMARFNQVLQKNVRGIEPACEKLLEQYDWPGNIRELKNVIQRAVLICDKDLIAPEHLPARFLAQQQKCPVASFAVGISLDEMERQMIVLTLSFTQNNRTSAAQLLGISRRALYNRLRKYGIG